MNQNQQYISEPTGVFQHQASNPQSVHQFGYEDALVDRLIPPLQQEQSDHEPPFLPSDISAGDIPTGHFHTHSPAQSRYSGYHQNPQLGTAPATSYHIQTPYLNTIGGVVHQDTQQQVDAESIFPLPPASYPGKEMSNSGRWVNISSNQIQCPINRSIQSPNPVSKKITVLQDIRLQPTSNLVKQEINQSGNTRMTEKFRIVYNDRQRIELDNEFASSKGYILAGRKSELASKLGISELQVKVWFQNRRAKERRENKKRVQKRIQKINQHHNLQHLNPETILLQQPQLLYETRED